MSADPSTICDQACLSSDVETEMSTTMCMCGRPEPQNSLTLSPFAPHDTRRRCIRSQSRFSRSGVSSTCAGYVSVRRHFGRGKFRTAKLIALATFGEYPLVFFRPPPNDREAAAEWIVTVRTRTSRA